MVQLTTFLAILSLSSSAVFSYPLSRRQQQDEGLLQNGQEAQKLNAAFQTLKGSDQCNNGDIACVEGALALCRGNNWVTQNCPATLQCFALPDVDQAGVTIGCTSNKTADALISATGAQGGIDGSSLNSTSTDPNNTDNNNNGTGVATVTVTVSVDASGATQTLSSTTTTLTPDQAGAVVAGASTTSTDSAATGTASAGTTIDLGGAAAAAPTPAPTNGAALVNPAPSDSAGTTIILGGGAAPAAATPAPVNGAVVNNAPAGTTIDLNAPPAPTPAVAAAAASSPPAAPAAPAAGGYY